MSQYVNFYAHKDGVFVSLTDYSRSNPMYKALEYDVPYEQGCILTKKIVSKAVDWFDNEIRAYENRIGRLIRENDSIEKLTDSLEKKLARIGENLDYIEDCSKEIAELKAQKAELYFIFRIKAEVWVGIEYNPNHNEEEE